jgi:tripartite-type tricarboxylate transporter receptor subunit TctC
MITDVIGGTIDSAITSIPAIVGPVSSGQVRAIAMSGDERAAALPDVPTFKEQGIEDPDAHYNLSLLAPANTPPQVVDRIAKDVAQIIKSDTFKSRHLTPFAFEVIGDSPTEFSAYLAKERPLQTERVLRSGAVLD